MRVPVEWLKAFVPVRLSPAALAERLTMAGLEVVAVHESDDGPVLDLEITPNRADCLSVLGVAREVAAITGQRLKTPTAQLEHKSTRAQEHKQVSIKIEDRAGCMQYIGRVIEGVRVGPSPDWMQRRLLACGARPINVIVDITNYVLFELGQPLHAFDFDRLAQGTILVRRAKPRDSLTTLDGVARALAPQMLVIADAQRAVAVAGIMGGSGSEVTASTRRILLESALFDPITVRRTARALGLASESSYRFERGVDPAGVEAASWRAAELLRELAGGDAGPPVEAGSLLPARRVIAIDGLRVNRWLGTGLSPSAMRGLLAKLGCRVASSGDGRLMRVSAPSFRQDLRQEVDVAEEIARLHGYERLPSALPAGAVLAEPSEDTAGFWRLQSLRSLCASLGLTETISWSLLSEAQLARCGLSTSQAVRVANPLSQDHAVMRPSLLPGLLESVRHNAARGAEGVRIFEVGAVASPQEPESLRLGIALWGLWARDWQGQQPNDFFRLTGLIEALTGRLGVGEARLVPAAHPWAEPGVAASVQLNESAIGATGQVARAITQALDVASPVWVAELAVGRLLSAARPPAPVRAPATLPPVKRDLSLFLDASVPFADVQQAIREAGGPLASRVELIDRYTGRSVPSGRYSLTFTIEYRDPARTLTAAEADAAHQRIGQALVSRFGAILR